MRPCVSVLLSVYNTSPFIRQCLDSIRNQTLKEIEIICVDDSSTDDSLDILKEYEKKDSRIIVVSQKHGGAGKARNTALDIASGEYISILDSDDFFEEDMLSKAYSAAKAQNADIAVFRSDFFDNNTKIFEPCVFSVKQDLLPKQAYFCAEDIPDRIFNFGCGWAWDKLFRKEFVNKYDLHFQEIRTTNDMFFVFYAYTKAERIVFLDELLVHQRIHVSGSLSVTRELSWNNFYNALLALKDALIADGVYEKYRKSFVNWALNLSLWHIDTIAPVIKLRLIKSCREEYFDSLGITGNHAAYFYNKKEFERLQDIMTDHNGIKVSVIISVFNGLPHIKRCLDTVCGQTLKEIQIICVDDGSVDETFEVLQEYEKRDPRVTAYKKDKHTNAGDGRNLGIQFAVGEYLSILDSDDFFEPDMLESAYNEAVRADADIVAFGSNMYDNNSGQFIDSPWTLKLHQMPRQSPFSCHDCSEHIFTMTNCAAWNKLFRKSFIDENSISFQSIESCNDMLFTFSAFSLAGRFAVIDRVLVHQRIGHPKALAKKIEYLWHNFYDALMGLKSFLIGRNIYATFKKAFVNWAIDFSLWNSHNYQGFYGELIKRCLVNRFFSDLDISTSGEEDFFDKNLYREMAAMMSGRTFPATGGIPKISVVIPVHNAAPYLPLCIESVINQTLADIEIICVDDCSTDGSHDVLLRYANIDPRIRIIENKERLNAGGSRNIGLEAANGEYVHFLDADDFLIPDAYERIYNAAFNNRADWIKARTYKYNNETSGVESNPWFDLSEIGSEMFGRRLSFEEDYTSILKCSVAPWNGIYKRSFLIESGCRFNDLICVNDRSFFIATLLKAQRIFLYDGHILYYRTNIKDSLVALRAKNFECHFKSAKQIMDMCEGLPLSMRNYIISKEIWDIINWFNKFRYEHFNHIFPMTQDFFRELQNANLDIEPEKQDWYRAAEDIIELPADVYAEKYDIQYQCYSELTQAEIKVSVIVAVYNAAKWLRRCLDSLINQDLKEIEIICIDDASTDNSLKILKSYSEKDHRVKVFSLPVNKGPAAARNIGLQYCTGMFVSCLDADDYFEKDMLSSMFREAADKTLDVVICKSIEHDTLTGRSLEMVWAYRTEFLPKREIFSYKDMPDHILNFVVGWSWDKMIRRNLIKNNHLAFQDIRRNEDVVFTSMALVCARRISFIDQVFVHHRTNTGFSQQDTYAMYPFDFYYAAKELKRQLVEKGIFDEVERSFINRFLTASITHVDLLRDSPVYYEVLLELKSRIFDEMELTAHMKDYYHEYNLPFYDRMQEILSMPYSEICRKSMDAYKCEIEDMKRAESGRSSINA